MKPLKLKVKFRRIDIIMEALLNYADHCTFYNEDSKMIEISIATELYYKLQAQNSKRYPPETYKIPLELHQAIVLQRALLRYGITSENVFVRNEVEIVKNALNNEIVNLSITAQ